LYHTAHVLHGKVIDYDKLIAYLQDKHQNGFDRRFAYVSQTDNSRSFETYLRSRQFVVRSKTIRENKLDTFDVDLTVDAMSFNDKLTVICSSSLNLLPLVKYINDQGHLAIIQSCGIPHLLKELCSASELPPSLMRAA